MNLMELINLYAFPVGFVAVGLFSGMFALLLPRPQNVRYRWWLRFGIPSVLAISVLFSPIRGMAKDSPSEPTCGWDVMLLAMWAGSGIFASSIVIDRKDRKFKRQSEQPPNP
jgi:hypothetical protein